MSSATLEQYSIHHINLDTGKLIKATTPPKGGDIQTYSTQTLKEIRDSERGKLFSFASDSEEIATLALRIIKGEWEEPSQKIANRLLRTEISTQKELGGFQEIKKGSLLQMKFTADKSTYLVFTKVDHGRILDATDNEIHFGLPFEKKVQKTCIIEFSPQGKITEIKVFDTNQTISKYWYKDFLCCQAVISSEENTKKAFSEIDKLLKKEILPKSKPDYNYLRNNIITYFRSNESLAYDDFIKDVVAKYPPISPSVDIDKFSEKLRKLPKEKKFDSQFEIDKASINARIKRVVILAENFELNIKGEVKDLERLVDTGIDDGRKYLKIYSDDGYHEFHHIKNNGQ